MADNPALAQVTGINTRADHPRHLDHRRRRSPAWPAPCWRSTSACKPDLAFNIVLPIFAAAIVGGLGQAYGAIAGGFLVGFAETLAVFNWTTVLRPFAGLLPSGLGAARRPVAGLDRLQADRGFRDPGGGPAVPADRHLPRSSDMTMLANLRDGLLFAGLGLIVVVVFCSSGLPPPSSCWSAPSSMR